MLKFQITLFVSLLFACVFKLNAQTFFYKGVILNSDNSQCSVLLINKIDSNLKYSTVTQLGKFEFNNLPIGDYNRCITYYKIKQCDTLRLSKNITNDTLVIENKQILQEVTVTSKSPLIENRAGVLSVNVAKSAIMTSGSVFDMLTKLPGITYNAISNTFKLKGKEGIQIQIDGQTLYLTGNELSDYIKNILADDVSTVEINSSPSSKYEAAGSAGIINIKIKKNKKEGFFTGINFNSRQGKYYKQNGGAKIQYNTKNSTYLFNYLNSLDNNFEQALTNTLLAENNTKQYTYAKIKGKSNNVNLQFVNQYKKSTLLLNTSVLLYKENILQNTLLDFYSMSLNADSNLTSIQKSNNTLKDYTFGATYTIDNEKTIYIFKSHFIHYDINNRSKLTSFMFPSNFAFYDLSNINPNKINLLVVESDIEYAKDSLNKFEYGAKAVYQNLVNRNDFYKLSFDQSFFDLDKSNDYSYNEYVFGTYFQYKKKIKKFDFSVGTRFEYSPSTGLNKKNNYLLKRNLANLFPYFNLSYNFSDINNFDFSYSKRINRPVFNDLMPFVYYVNLYTKLVGNPTLLPFISHQLEFQYILKQNYIFSVAYSINQNQIFQTPIPNNQNLSTTLTPYNIKRGNSLSITSNLTLDFFSWWNINFNGIVFYDSIKSNDNNLIINASLWSGQVSVTNEFSLPKRIKSSLVTDYVAPFIQGPYKTDNIFSLNASISKSFKDDKMKISVIGNDILRTYKFKNTSIIENQISNINQRFDTNWIRLSVSLKFNKGLKREPMETDKSVDDIKSRIK